MRSECGSMLVKKRFERGETTFQELLLCEGSGFHGLLSQGDRFFGRRSYFNWSMKNNALDWFLVFRVSCALFAWPWTRYRVAERLRAYGKKILTVATSTTSLLKIEFFTNWNPNFKTALSRSEEYCMAAPNFREMSVCKIHFDFSSRPTCDRMKKKLLDSRDSEPNGFQPASAGNCYGEIQCFSSWRMKLFAKRRQPLRLHQTSCKARASWKLRKFVLPHWAFDLTIYKLDCLL